MANPNRALGDFCATKARSPERQEQMMREFAQTDFAKDCDAFARGEMSADAFRAKHFPNA